MKANGRRRWRKNLYRLRRKTCRELSREDAETHPVSYCRRHCELAWTQDPSPLPAREFSARSLCGMSMGARKRAARLACVGHPFRRRVKLVWFKAWARDMHGRILTEADQKTLAGYATQRAKYRLSERLRPCLVCQRGKCKLPCRDCFICDGSGVLPAKRHRRCGWWLQTRTAKNATQRCGMPTSDGWLDCRNCGGSGWLPARRERP